MGGRSGGLPLLFLVVECFQEGRGEFEYVVEFVEFVDGDEGGWAANGPRRLACELLLGEF